MQFFVDAAMGEVEAVVDGRHGFEAEEGGVRRGVDFAGGVVGTELDFELLLFAGEQEGGAAGAVADEIGEAVVEVAVGEGEVVWRGDQLGERAGFAGGEELIVQGPFGAGWNGGAPLGAGGICELEKVVIAEGEGHGFLGVIGDFGADFESAVFEMIGHFDDVREGELGHPFGAAGDVETAGELGAFCVGVEAGDLPVRGEREEAVDGVIVSVEVDVFERPVEGVAAAVGVEGGFIEAVGKGGEEGDAAHLRFLAEGGEGGGGEVEDVMAVDEHFVGDVAEGGEDGDGGFVAGVGEADGLDAVDGLSGGGVVLGEGRESEE